jgi:hypothetical protein
MKDYGQLDVTGTTHLDGTLAIDLVDGFRLSYGDKFDILDTATKALGNFSALDLNGVDCSEVKSRFWHCTNLDDLTLVERFTRNGLQLNVVPEPDSLMLFLGGFGALAMITRRRRARLPFRALASRA